MEKIILAIVLCIPTLTNSAIVSIDTSNANFTQEAVMNIVKSTSEQCEQIDNAGIGRAVWVEVESNGYQYKECIRYYPFGLLDNQVNNRSIIYFSGDVWTASGVPLSYTNQKPLDKQNEAVVWSTQLHNHPYIFIARPGIYGSSGVHNGARKPLEHQLMSEALNKIKSRHQILNYVAVGHSSGGHVVASLLSQRRDILCAVVSSSPSSPKERALILNKPIPTKEFEAVDAITISTPKHPALRVFVVGDLVDSTVPWGAQSILHTKIQSLSWVSNTINLVASDSAHHILADQARQIAGMCSRGLPTQNILDNAQTL